MQIEKICDLTSDHTPVLLTIGTAVIKKPKRQNLTTKHTDWRKFRKILSNLITLQIRLKTTEELELQSKKFIEHVRIASKNSTPAAKEAAENEVNYTYEISNKTKQARQIGIISAASKTTLTV